MKFASLLLLFLLSAQLGEGQVFSIRPGQMFYHSKTITPVLDQRRAIQNRDYFSFHFDYYTLRRKLQLGLSYSFYSGWTEFRVDAPRWGGNGGSAVFVQRYAIKLGYNLLQSTTRLKIVPQFRVIFEDAKVTFSSGEIGYIDSRVDNNFEGAVIVNPLNSFQVLPALGVDMDWNIWWRFHLTTSLYHAWGHQPFQEFYFEYTYQGQPQPTAEWHSDGTGWFASIGLGMRIWGYRQWKAERAAGRTSSRRGRGKKGKRKRGRR